MEASALRHHNLGALHGPSPLLRLQSDERLIALVRRGQQAAFEVLVARYQARLLAFCRHMLSSREDAEDVLQEVFAAAFNAILADDRPINVRPWLYRIARNRSLNHLRRASAIGVDSMDTHFAENGISTGEKVMRRESFRQLIADVGQLPETQRSALLLREIDALSYEQIAVAMETTVPSVKSLLVRARISLAEAAEARKLTCDEVRLELGRVAEGLAKMDPLVRRHLRGCERCSSLRKQLKANNRALAAIMPVAPLFMLKKLILARLGSTAGAGGAHVAGAGAGTAGAGAAGAGAAGAGAAGAGAAGAGAGAAIGGSGAGGLITAGAGALATKAAAGLAAAAIVTAGAVAADNTGAHHRHHASHPVRIASVAPAPAPAPAPSVPVAMRSTPQPASVSLSASAKVAHAHAHARPGPADGAPRLATNGNGPAVAAGQAQPQTAESGLQPETPQSSAEQVVQVTSGTTALPSTPTTVTTPVPTPVTTTPVPTTPVTSTPTTPTEALTTSVESTTPTGPTATTESTEPVVTTGTGTGAPPPDESTRPSEPEKPSSPPPTGVADDQGSVTDGGEQGAVEDEGPSQIQQLIHSVAGR